MHDVSTGEGLPSPNGDIDVLGFNFHPTRASPSPLGCEERRTSAAERVEDDVVAAGTVLYRVGDHHDWLHCWVIAQIVHPARLERVRAGILPDVGAVSAVASQLNCV